MKTKIVKLPLVQFLKPAKQRPLSDRMINGLRRAYSLQKEGIAFGQRDIDGAFLPLINRGLIIRKEKLEDNNMPWYIPDEAVSMLENMGIQLENEKVKSR